MKTNLIIIVALCALSLYPVASISRWFTSSYYDVRVTLRRYARCEGSLTPLKKQGLSDTEFLVEQMKGFLDQANYDNEQLANISQLMGIICISNDKDTEYPISINIDVDRYNNSKANRCKAIDRAMDSMFTVFKRAALNKSEPLDFSVIQYPADNPQQAAASKADAHYNLTDLINTVWISSEAMLDQTCNITRSVDEYIKFRMSNATAQDRSQQQHSQGFIASLMDLIDRLLDPILGLQKRLYWDGNNRVEFMYNGISNQLSNLRDGLGKGYKSTRDRLSGMFSSPLTNSSVSTNSTSTSVVIATNLNDTKPLTSSNRTSSIPFVNATTTNLNKTVSP